MTEREYSKVYWPSKEQKEKYEELIKKDFSNVSEGIRNIIRAYYLLINNKEASS